MRLRHFSATFLCVVFTFLPVLACCQTIAKMSTACRGLPTVSVLINGSGPYPFLLDTGSNRTMVQNELLAKLEIASPELVPVEMVNGISYLQQAVAKTVAVGSAIVHRLVIEGIGSRQLSQVAGSCRGVLGEDFLERFDVLIDNREKSLTLDYSPGLASSLTGDRVPLSLSGTHNGYATNRRPVLDLRLPDQPEIAHFLIDSGSNHAFFYPSKSLPFQLRAESDGTLMTPYGQSRCYAKSVPLKRIATADDVALAVLACATHLRYSTGCIIAVDGGKML